MHGRTCSQDFGIENNNFNIFKLSDYGLVLSYITVQVYVRKSYLFSPLVFWKNVYVIIVL
jgi:hypothetical protein